MAGLFALLYGALVGGSAIREAKINHDFRQKIYKHRQSGIEYYTDMHGRYYNAKDGVQIKINTFTITEVRSGVTIWDAHADIKKRNAQAYEKAKANGEIAYVLEPYLWGEPGCVKQTALFQYVCLTLKREYKIDRSADKIVRDVNGKPEYVYSLELGIRPFVNRYPKPDYTIVETWWEEITKEEYEKYKPYTFNPSHHFDLRAY